ncbi:MAG: retroviral-like aspartic protease family protein [Bacteroidetes bacterium]|nr:retroviral-like aspartic protease family protein [Bacteroidota bacterium]
MEIIFRTSLTFVENSGMKIPLQGNRLTFFPGAILVAVFMLLAPAGQRAEKVPDNPCFIITSTLSFPGISFRTGGAMGELEMVIIPLKRVGNLFMIEAKIDDETGNFLFDTGASQLVLNTTYFRKYITIDETEARGVTGLTGSIRRTTVKRMQVAGLIYNNITADVTELGHIENRRGVKVLGLFGLSMLKGLEMVIDLKNNELRLYRLDKDGNRIGAHREEFRADITAKVVEYHNVLFMKARIGGKELDFCLDTGAESNVLNCYAPRKVMSTVTILRRSDMMGVGTDKAEVLFGDLNDFNVGEHPIPGMQAIIASLNALATSYGYPIDGMLGYDFFSKGKVCINLVKNELKISLNKAGKN